MSETTRGLTAESLEANKGVYEEFALLIEHHLSWLPEDARQKVSSIDFPMNPVIKGRKAIHMVRVAPPELDTAALRVRIENPLYGVSSVFDLYPSGELHELRNSLENPRPEYDPGFEDLVFDFNFYRPDLRTTSPTIQLGPLESYC